MPTIAISSNGKTRGFGPRYVGSIPTIAANGEYGLTVKTLGCEPSHEGSIPSIHPIAYSPSGCWDYADNVVVLSSTLR
jgi:hypothetical protein